jgi:quinol monooxygenase YgiN
MFSPTSTCILGAHLTVITLSALIGCGDDPAETGGSQAAATSSSAAGSGGGPGSGGAASSASGTGGPGSGGGAGAAVIEYDAILRGTFASSDMAVAQAGHDQLAQGGEEQSKALGDFEHHAMLGTTLLGTTENEYFALDRWHGSEGMDALYGDPGFQRALGTIFADIPDNPRIEEFIRQPEWLGWGDTKSGDRFTPHHFVVVRGLLTEDDPAEAQAAHDAIVGAVPAHPDDVAHVVFTGRVDPREFLAIDIWKDPAEIEAFYTNPAFQEAVGQLFAPSTATLGVYVSTDWYQW